MSETDEAAEQDLQHVSETEEDIMSRYEPYYDTGPGILCVYFSVLVNGMPRSVSMFPTEGAFYINSTGLNTVDYALDEVRFICPDYSKELTVVYFEDRIRIEFASLDDKSRFVYALDVKQHELKPVNLAPTAQHWMDGLFDSFANEVEEETFIAEEAFER